MQRGGPAGLKVGSGVGTKQALTSPPPQVMLLECIGFKYRVLHKILLEEISVFHP